VVLKRSCTTWQEDTLAEKIISMKSFCRHRSTKAYKSITIRGGTPVERNCVRAGLRTQKRRCVSHNAASQILLDTQTTG